MKNERSPACLYQEPDLVERTVRDFLTEEVDRVLIDSKEDHERTQKLVGQISKRSAGKIALYKDSIPIFERFNIERQIEQTGQRKVPLPSRRRNHHRRNRGAHRDRREHRFPQEPRRRREERHLRREPRGRGRNRAARSGSAISAA